MNIKKINNNSIVRQTTLSGIMSGLGVLLGAFGHFSIGTGGVYLIGIIIFLLPIVLKMHFAFISSTVIILLTDLINGWIAFSWISFIAYTISIIIIFVFCSLKFKGSYFLGILLASLVNILIYFSLESIIFGTTYAIKDLIATVVQFSIIIPITYMLYFPFKTICLNIL